jgi:hypothetical protein
MRAPRPTGFVFLCVCALLCAAVMGWLLTGDAAAHTTMPGRLAIAATGALALVTAEALAFVRPWAYRASIAFGVAFVVRVAVLTDRFVMAAAACAAPLVFIIIALGIVRRGLPAAPAQRIPRPLP